MPSRKFGQYLVFFVYENVKDRNDVCYAGDGK
jgi:hypothetical protein